MIIDLGRKDYKLSLVSQRLDGLYAVQGETARTFKFKLVDSEGQSVDAVNYTLTLSIAYYTGVVSCSTKGSADGTFTLVLPQDVLIDYGDYLCQIQISQDQDMVASAIGEIHIERNLQIDNGHGSNLLVDFKVIKQHVVMVKELANEVNGVLNKTITQSDRACQCADKSQRLYDSLTTVMAEETERKNAENARKQAETDRTQAENERKSAEVLRDQRITESVQKVNESIHRVDESIHRVDESIQKLGNGVNLEPIKEDIDKVKKDVESAKSDIDKNFNNAEVIDDNLVLTRKNGTDIRVTLPKGFSGSYNDLTNKPDMSKYVQATVFESTLAEFDTSVSEAYNGAEVVGQTLKLKRFNGQATDITLPKGFSGSYTDLTNKPDMTGYATKADMTGYATKAETDKKLDKSGGTMTGALVAAPDSTGVAQVYNMVVVAKGASTANIPNNTIIVEVE